MNTLLHFDRSESNMLQCYSALDDARLPVHAFRLLLHLARRCSGKDFAWPGVASMAEICVMHEDSVYRSLDILKKRNFITVQKRPGRTTLYSLTPPSQWLPPSPDEPAKAPQPTPQKRGTRKSGVPVKAGYHHPEDDGYHHPERDGYEGNPRKGIQGSIAEGSDDPPAGGPVDAIANTDPTSTPVPPERPSTAEKKPRRRNVAFDALAELDGGGDTLTPSAAGRIGKALAEIRTAWPIKLPDKPKDAERDEYEARLAAEIRLRVREYRQIFPGAMVTSSALAVHWGRCATRQSPASPSGAPAPGRYPLPEGCPWRAIAKKIGVRIDFDTPWNEVGFEARRRILEAHAAEGLIS